MCATILAIIGSVFLAAAGEARTPQHRIPAFHESVGFASLVGTIGYLAALIVWAWIRGEWVFLVRHLVSAAGMLLLVMAYLAARGGFGYNGHTWNQSFGDTSVILYAVTLGIGPLARLWRPASKALAWRRETSIWATIAAAIHVLVFWEWSLGWDWRPFFLPEQQTSALGTAFHVANIVGLVALVYAMLLAFTSNDISQRWLRSGWSWLQKRATTMWLLVLLHTWIFGYYVTFSVPLATTLWVSFWTVLVLQTAGFVKTVRRRRQGSPIGETAPAD